MSVRVRASLNGIFTKREVTRVASSLNTIPDIANVKSGANPDQETLVIAERSTDIPMYTYENGMKKFIMNVSLLATIDDPSGGPSGITSPVNMHPVTMPNPSMSVRKLITKAPNKMRTT
jgi:hypothetical protein